MKIIFICTGNTCRSPLAEGYLKSFGIKNLEVLSRGIYADGSAANENSIKIAAEYGIDISSHISKNICADDLDADRFICMDFSHKSALESMGIQNEKLSVLAGGIPDPYGAGETVYRNTANCIFDAIDALVYSGSFTDFCIGKAELKDISKIAQLEKECFSTPWSENAILESLSSGYDFLAAVDKGGELLGYAGISCILDEGYISNIAVFEKHRSIGIGNMLIMALLSLSRKKELKFISLEVRASNEGAIRLYEKNGFITEGRRKNFYEHPHEDAIIMTRRFNSI